MLRNMENNAAEFLASRSFFQENLFMLKIRECPHMQTRMLEARPLIDWWDCIRVITA